MSFENSTIMKLAGVCGIVGPVVALSLVLLAVASSPWFTWEGNALSDLGVREAAVLFNSGVIFAGILNFFFAVGVRVSLKKTLLTNVGTIVLIAGGASLALVGIFTESTPAIHSAVSLGYFVIFPVALIIVGAGLARGEAKAFGPITVLAGIAALVAIFGTAQFYEGLAIPEILEALILAAWSVSMGARLLTQTSKV
ncbi:MAG: DUF998 domain-containing protein [Candidatus Geothermarchaeales archaeon]